MVTLTRIITDNCRKPSLLKIVSTVHDSESKKKKKNYHTHRKRRPRLSFSFEVRDSK